jgi:signal peptidase I
VFCWLSILLAAASAVYGFWDPRFFLGTLLLLAALYYWLAIRWVDRHGGWPTAARNPGAKLLGWVLLAATVACVTLLVVLSVFIGYYQIPQNGMYPGRPAGSRLFAFRHPYRNPSEVRRGDVVIFTRVEAGQEYLYIWRVVGLPADAVEVAGDAVVVNGQPLPREKVRAEGGQVIYREPNGDAVYEVAYDVSPPEARPPDVAVRVPAAHFFVLGDNRYHAVDSRYFGPIPFESIIAKSW